MQADNLKMLAFVVSCSLLMVLVIVAAQVGFYSPDDGVVALTTDSFEQEVLQDDAIWVVQFYAVWCANCHGLKAEYKKLATLLKGVIKVGIVNAERHTQLSANYQIRGYPTIKIFGADKTQPTDYVGQRTAEAIGAAVVAEINKKLSPATTNGGVDSAAEPVEQSDETRVSSSGFDNDVVDLTSESFDELVLKSPESWLLMFFSLDSDQSQDLAHDWARVASELSGQIKVGALDGLTYKDQAAAYNVHSYPTVLYLPATSKLPSAARTYAGPQAAAPLVKWASEQLTGLAANVELVQLTGESSLYSACKDKVWCMIGVLPKLRECNAHCRRQLLAVLREMGAQFGTQRWGWLWGEGGQQPFLERGLAISRFAYPTVAAFNCGKFKYAIFKGDFKRLELAAFFDSIVNGREQSTYIECEQRPSLKDVAAWNGEDHPQLDKQRQLADEL